MQTASAAVKPAATRLDAVAGRLAHRSQAVPGAGAAGGCCAPQGRQGRCQQLPGHRCEVRLCHEVCGRFAHACACQRTDGRNPRVCKRRLFVHRDGTTAYKRNTWYVETYRCIGALLHMMCTMSVVGCFMASQNMASSRWSRSQPLYFVAHLWLSKNRDHLADIRWKYENCHRPYKLVHHVANLIQELESAGALSLGPNKLLNPGLWQPRIHPLSWAHVDLWTRCRPATQLNRHSI